MSIPLFNGLIFVLNVIYVILLYFFKKKTTTSLPYNVSFFYSSGILNSNIIYKYVEQTKISINKFIMINVPQKKTKISWKNKNVFGLKANNFSQEKQKVTILGKREGDQCFCLLFQLFCNKQSEINIMINKAHGIKMRKKRIEGSNVLFTF